jgi:hypothetical protein
MKLRTRWPDEQHALQKIAARLARARRNRYISLPRSWRATQLPRSNPVVHDTGLHEPVRKICTTGQTAVLCLHALLCVAMTQPFSSIVSGHRSRRLQSSV